jgi:hypothetical protein
MSRGGPKAVHLTRAYDAAWATGDIDAVLT